MRKFFTNLLIAMLPALLLIGYLEMRLSKMDTQYYDKPRELEKQLDQLEILCLGSSNGYFDFNPTYFSHPAYNLGLNAQSPYYDYELLKKYIDRMPKLKVVVLPAIFLSMGWDLPKTSQSWRMFFYRQYFDIALEPGADGSTSSNYILEPKNFSKIALYGANVPNYISHHFKTKIDYHPENNGWYNSAEIRIGKPEDKNGETAASAHNEMVDVSLFPYNLSYWQRIADMLKGRNISLVVVRLPADSTYYKNLDPDKIKKFQDALTEFTSKNHAAYFDYTEDSRFNFNDYTFMVDHMNPEGAEKFSRIFDKEVLKPLFQTDH